MRMQLRLYNDDDADLHAYDVGREVAVRDGGSVMGYATPEAARAFAAELIAAADQAEKNEPVPGLDD